MHEEIHTFIYWHICLNRKGFLGNLESSVGYVLEDHFTKEQRTASSKVKGKVKRYNRSVFIEETKEPLMPSTLPSLMPAGAGVVLGL